MASGLDPHPEDPEAPGRLPSAPTPGTAEPYETFFVGKIDWQLGNSDSHAPWSVGCCYTDFDAEIRTTADLVAAIRGKKGIAKVNENAK